jgi:hypothetical protein
MNKSPLESAAIAKNIYNEWIEAMICPKNNVCRVLDLYHEQAVLLPTFSPVLCTTRAQLNTYFENLIKLPTLSITTEELLTSECNKVIVNSGIYTFQYRAAERLITIPARFSFVYKNFDGKWLIVNHHSSVLPVQPTSF